MSTSNRSIFKWNSVNQISTLLVRLGVSLVLQRLLLPKDFGLVANIMVFAEISLVFVDSGFQGAIIQTKDINQRGLSSAFFLNLTVGAVFTTALLLFAPSLGKFYNEPEIVPITRFMSVIYVLQSASLVQRALLVRRHKFKIIAIADVTSSLIAGVFAIFIAYHFKGSWAIASMYVVQILMSNIVLWFGAHWRPSAIIDFAELLKMWRYGSKIFLNGLFIYINTRIDLFLIGKFFSPAKQGYYSTGKRYGTMPTNIFVGIVTKSYFPIFARIQDDKELLIKTYKYSLSRVSFLSGISFPLFFIVAPEAVYLILTDKWLAMTPILQTFLIFSSIHVINSLNANFLAAIGRPKFTLINSAFSGTLRLITISTYFWLAKDPNVLLIASIIALFSFIENHISSYFIRKCTHVKVAEQYLNAYKENLLGWTVGLACYFTIRNIQFLQSWPALKVFILILSFSTLYILACTITKSESLNFFLKRKSKLQS